MEEADAMEDLVAAESRRMTSNQYRNMKEVSTIFTPLPQPISIQKLDQWLGVIIITSKNFANFLEIKKYC
jgi:hypothetical protein